jgi:putative membrane protein
MLHGMGNFGWGLGFGWIFMILVWGLAILGLIAVFKWLSGSGAQQMSAREILQQRYARGEIDQQEYQQKMGDLDR